MAQTSYPFDGSSITESQFSEFFRQLQDTGVACSAMDSDLSAVGDSSGMNVKVQPGFAIVRGHAYQSTAVEPLTISTADTTAARTDLVVLRLNPAANSIVLAVLTGTPGAGAPTPTQTDVDVYELVLASVHVAAHATTIAPADVTDIRTFTGNRTGVWTTGTRPPMPRIGQLGLNTTVMGWEMWMGDEWMPHDPIVEWTTIQNLPTTFAPAPHMHALADINAPSGFPAAAHSHTWASITSKPTKFDPSAHTHDWSDIHNEPNFSLVGHDHDGRYLRGDDTIARANGSARPHDTPAQGPGPWYAVWVNANGSFMRNTSSIKFKQNVRDYVIDPEDVLALRPVAYDRKDTAEGVGRKGEVGLIAEEVEPHLPWLINYLDGEVDGLRYDLLGVALIPVVQRQAKQIVDLEARLARLEAAFGE